jgi:hypothetical protein
MFEVFEEVVVGVGVASLQLARCFLACIAPHQKILLLAIAYASFLFLTSMTSYLITSNLPIQKIRISQQNSFTAELLDRRSTTFSTSRTKSS